MNQLERIKHIVYEMWTNEFGMKKQKLPSLVECKKEIECYKYKGHYLRLDSFKDTPNSEPTLVVECAADIEEAQKNTFEDAFLYNTDETVDKIIAEMKLDLPDI